jgi:hypothetical protein
MIGFIIGAVAGAAAMYYWRDRVRGYVDDKLPGVRDRAADTLGSVGRNVETVLERARDRIDSNVRAGQERLRSVGTRPAGTAAGGMAGFEERPDPTRPPVP